MKKSKISNLVAKGTVSALNKVLLVDANSTSCIIQYQTKQPKEIERFRRMK